MVDRSAAGRRRRVVKVAAVAAVLTVVALLLGADSFGGAPSLAAAGNNGTVKVDGMPFDQHQDNEPHPSCAFELTFFNYDQGPQQASYAFRLQPPSGTADLVSDTLNFGGGKGFDAGTGAIDLSSAIAASGAV